MNNAEAIFQALKPETKPQHTPTPWRIEPHKNHKKKLGIYKAYEDNSFSGLCAIVPDCLPNQEANAAYIVRAVNCHEELWELAKRVKEHSTNPIHVQAAKQAIAKAEAQ